MANDTVRNSIRTKIMNKYSYLVMEEVDSLILDAEQFYLSLRFPFHLDTNIEEITINKRAEYLIYKICIEQIERNGFTSSTGYRESGTTLTFDSSQVSRGLTRLIKPKVGTIILDEESEQ